MGIFNKPKYTTKYEYEKVRVEEIVNKIYGGKDDIPLETKEQLLIEKYPGCTINFHVTRLDENGRNVPGSDGHARMYQKVACLELTYLEDMHLIVVPYC